MKHLIKKSILHLSLWAALIGATSGAQAQVTATSISGASNYWNTAGSFSGAGSISGTAGMYSSAMSVSGTAGWISGGVYTPVEKKGYKPPQYREHRDELKADRLAKYNFKLAGDKLIDISKAPEVELGQIRVVDAQMVFEWADQDYHEYWVSNGGISPAEMAEIIAEHGQAAGKGYYVSLDPLDSAYYGPALTVFHPKKPIVALEYSQQASTLVMDNTEFVQRLSDAGIQALRYPGYTETWLAVINASVLRKATGLPKSLFLKMLEDPNVVFTFLTNNTNIPLDQYGDIPNLDPFVHKVLKKEPLSLADLQTLRNTPWGNNLAGRILNESLRILSGSYTSQTLQAIGKILNGMTLFGQAAVLSQFQADHQDQIQARYLSILDYFDLATVVRGAASSTKIVSTLKNYVDRYEQRKSQIALDKVLTMDDFHAAVQKVFGFQAKYRSQRVMVPSLFESSLTYQTLTYDPFLQTQPSSQNISKTVVEYANLDRLRYYKAHLSPQLQADIDTLYQGAPMDPNSALAQETLKKALQEITAAVFNTQSYGLQAVTGVPSVFINSPSFYSIQERVKLFLKLHPFEQNNEHIAWLFRDIVAVRISYQGLELKQDFIPVHNLHMVTEEYSAVPTFGFLLKVWVSEAKDDAEFIARSREALKVFFEVYPEYKTTSPKLQ